VNDVPVAPVVTVSPAGLNAVLAITAPAGIVTEAEVVIVVPETPVTVMLVVCAPICV
jgi:hypothetical protein